MLAALALAACAVTSDPADDDASARPSLMTPASGLANGVRGAQLVRVDVEPPGSHCPAGGQAILVGYDANRNGVLDAEEVTSVSYVCNGENGTTGRNGEDGASALVTVTAEPPGVHCAAGGQRIDVGIDADRDGTLGATEIATTTYVCNGADAPAGVVLTRVLPLADGDATCPDGGEEVQAGLDASGDGVLEAAEIAVDVKLCALVSATALPPGGACTYGGTHYDRGLDRNDDGVLQPAEITSSEDVCATGPACGAVGQACCPIASCGSGAVCSGDTCVACGVLGAPCCTSGAACSGASTVCNLATGRCVACGLPGQTCCGSDQTCRCAGSWTQCASTAWSPECGNLGGSCTSCQTCGGAGQACCHAFAPYPACGVSGSCHAGLVCGATDTCQ